MVEMEFTERRLLKRPRKHGKEQCAAGLKKEMLGVIGEVALRQARRRRNIKLYPRRRIEIINELIDLLMKLIHY